MAREETRSQVKHEKWDDTRWAATTVSKKKEEVGLEGQERRRQEKWAVQQLSNKTCKNRSLK
jgi:hypothetical protein